MFNELDLSQSLARYLQWHWHTTQTTNLELQDKNSIKRKKHTKKNNKQIINKSLVVVGKIDEQ